MEIKISNLRVIECGPLRDVIIDFNDIEKDAPQPITILGGANGTGKTTILELIFCLFDLFKISPNARFASIDDFNLGILEKTRSAELTVYIDRIPCVVFWGASENHGNIENMHGLERIDDDEGNQRWKITSRGILPKKINDFIKRLKKAPLNLPFYPYHQSCDYETPTILYFPFNRELIPVKGNQIYREEGNYQFNYRYQINKTFKGSFESYLIWLDYADQKLFQLAIEFLNSLNFQGKTFDIKRKELNVIVTTRDGRRHTLNELSSGEQSILIMLLEIRRRIIPGSIVLIDEIENSLHPEFQYAIANNLLGLQKEIPFQLLLSTHQHEFLKIFGKKFARILTKF